MAVKTIEELFIHALSDVHNADKQLTKVAEPLTDLGVQP
jgi:ferritin-like metal-binding protein YciE